MWSSAIDRGTTDGKGNILPYFTWKEVAVYILQKLVTDKVWMKSFIALLLQENLISMNIRNEIILLLHYIILTRNQVYCACVNWQC